MFSFFVFCVEFKKRYTRTPRAMKCVRICILWPKKKGVSTFFLSLSLSLQTKTWKETQKPSDNTEDERKDSVDIITEQKDKYNALIRPNLHKFEFSYWYFIRVRWQTATLTTIAYVFK